jgi:hypothetical protein
MKIIGKFRTDGDGHWYFVPKRFVDKFDNYMMELGLLDYYNEEWDLKNDEFEDEFGEYELNNPIETYLCEMDVE